MAVFQSVFALKQKQSLRSRLAKIIGPRLPFYKKYRNAKSESEELSLYIKRYLQEERAHVIYSSYEEALKNCGDGYQNEVLAEVIVKKTRLALSSELMKGPLSFSELNVLASLMWIKKANIKILDIGGAAGYLYYRVLPYCEEQSIKLDWSILETDTMKQTAIKAGFSTFNYIEQSELKNTNSAGYDIVLISGVLQYLPNPVEDLKWISKIKTDFIFIGRTSLLADSEQGVNSLVVIQESMLSSNGPGPLPIEYTNQKVYYPNTQIRRADLLGAFKDDFICVLSAEDQTGVYEIKNHKISGGSFLFERK